MIADLAAARFSSLATPVTAPGVFSADAGMERSVGERREPSSGALVNEAGGTFRPMRWILPWLWQLSQKPVPPGEPVEWELDLPEGDRLRLHAVQHRGEWHLDFSGSSRRLQRWLEQHRDELGARLERLIGKPVQLHIDPPRNLSSVS